MTPLEYIEKGILSGDWTNVCEGYKLLTGKDLSSPVEQNDTKILNDIIDIVSNHPTIKLRIPIEKKKRKTPIKNKKIKSESTDGEEDETVNINSNINTPTTRETGGIQLITNSPDPDEIERNAVRAKRTIPLKKHRAKSKTHKVKCSECEQTFDSSRTDGKYGQKCSACMNATRERFHA